MQYRSKSTQQKNIEREHHELRKKLNWVLNENSLPFPQQHSQDYATRQSKITRFHQANIHQILRKVDSFQKVRLVKKKTAIEELQQLVTPQETEERGHQWNADYQRRKEENQFQPYQEQSEVWNVRKEGKEIFGQQNQTVKYYKIQNNKLKYQLDGERVKNQYCLSIIKKLERANSQLQKEVSLLLNKYQASNANATRVKQLQSDFKQQLIVNLELEQMLLKKNLKIKEGASKLQNDQQRFSNQINQLKERMRLTDKEIRQLKETIDRKDQQINKLKEQLNMQPEDKIVQTPISLHQIDSYQKRQPKYLQRFLHFSKDIQARIGENKPKLISTDPSLQQATMDNENIRKISGSQIFKGNYCTLSLSFGQRKANKPSSKTDRL